MADVNAKLESIRGMLRKAEDPAATKEESEAFVAGAMRLIAKYGIDAALLDVPGIDPDKPNRRVIPMDGAYMQRRAYLLQVIAKALRCQPVLRERWKTNDDGTNVYTAGGRHVKTRDMLIYGFEADLDRVELLYTSLLVQAAHGMVRDSAQRYPWEGVIAYRNSWYSGFAETIKERLTAAEKQAEDEARPAASAAGKSVELVLADRSREVAQLFQAEHPKIKTTVSRLSGSGHGAGRAAGARADLGGKRVTRRTGAGRALGS